MTDIVGQEQDEKLMMLKLLKGQRIIGADRQKGTDILQLHTEYAVIQIDPEGLFISVIEVIP